MSANTLVIEKSEIAAIMVKRGLFGGAAVYLKSGRVISLHWTEGVALLQALKASPGKEGLIFFTS